MGAIIGIPTTRVSDLFVRQRLTNQLQADQLALFRTQSQLSTGHSILAPSENAPAAQRIISLQRLLERKEQVQTNLSTNQSYLLATDSALMTISNTVAKARGIALGASDSTTDETQRRTAAQQIERTVQQLLDVANQKFRGRYLFAGAGTLDQPFEMTEDYSVKYIGDEGRLSSYADIDLLFDSNVHGSEVFGAVSKPVRGSADLNPALTYNTRLADLRNGQGIARGSITIGVTTGGFRVTSTIDLSSAETIGDVAALIRANQPTAKTIRAEVMPTGLRITVASAPPDTLTIEEVAGGTTASDLGILMETGTTAPVIGNDLDPTLGLTTRIEDAFGSRAQARIESAGADDDLIFRAATNGTDLNGTTVTLNDMPGGPVAVNYDPVAHTLSIDIDTIAETTANDIIAALAADPAGAFFTAELDQTDGGSNDGDGPLSPSIAPVAMSGGSGTTLDLTSGLQIVNGAKTHVINVAKAETIEDLLNELNLSDAGVLAEINEDATGIDIRSRLSGDDFMIAENGGTTATQLGLRTFTEDVRLDDLNFGRGVATGEGTDFSVTLADGSIVAIDLTQSDGSGIVNQTDWDALPVMANGRAVPASVASALVTFDGHDNDLIISAVNPGVTLNDTEIVFEAVVNGTIAFNHDLALKRLTVQFNPETSTAQDIVDELALDAVGATFTAQVDPPDGGMPETIGELLDLINTDTDNVDPITGNPLLRAQLATFGNGIEMVDLTDGNGTMTIRREPTSLAALNLGLIPEGQMTTAGGTVVAAATATVASLGANNDLVFTAVQAGLSANNVDVVFRPEVGGPVSLNLNGSVLTVQYDPGVTTAADIVTAAAADPNFTAALVATDNTGSGTVATGTVAMSNGSVNTASSATMSFTGDNNNITFESQTPGVLLNDTVITLTDNPGGPITFTHDPVAKTLNVTFDSTAPTTAADIIAALRADPLGKPGNGIFSATLTASDGVVNNGAGLIAPADFPATAGATDGPATAASVTVHLPGMNNDLTFTTIALGSVNNGIQIAFREVPGGPVAANLTGQLLVVDFDPAVSTAADVVAAMAADPNFTVALDPADGAPNTGAGLVSNQTLDTTAGGSQVVTGTDVHRMETESVFTALIRIDQALYINDELERAHEIGRALELLDTTLLAMNFSRAELGARQQSLDLMDYRLKSEEIDLKAALSEDFDIDMVEAISQFTARQISMQASLQTAAAVMQLTLLDYL